MPIAARVEDSCILGQGWSVYVIELDLGGESSPFFFFFVLKETKRTVGKSLYLSSISLTV